MRRVNLVIVSRDILYLNRLKVYMIKKCFDNFNLCFISDLDIAKVELKKFDNGILLIEENIDKNEFEALKFNQILILSNVLVGEEVSENKVIHKYAPANFLCAQLINLYNKGSVS